MLDLRRRFAMERRSSSLTSNAILNWKYLLNPRFLKPFLIIHTVNVWIQLFCGIHLVINYSVDIVSRLTKTHDPFIVSTVLSLIRAPVSLIVGITMPLVGRRSFMMISGVGSAVSAIALGFVLYSSESVLPTAELREMLSIILLGVYVMFFTAGYYVVPTMMIGETQPAAIRGYLCGYIYTINDFTAGGVVKYYPWLLRSLGLHGIFLLSGISCAICVVFSYLFLPETNGKTLEEIEDYFKQKNIMWITRNQVSVEMTADFPEEQRLYEQAPSFSHTSE